MRKMKEEGEDTRPKVLLYCRFDIHRDAAYLSSMHMVERRAPSRMLIVMRPSADSHFLAAVMSMWREVRKGHSGKSMYPSISSVGRWEGSEGESDRWGKGKRSTKWGLQKQGKKAEQNKRGYRPSTAAINNHCVECIEK